MLTPTDAQWATIRMLKELDQGQVAKDIEGQMVFAAAPVAHLLPARYQIR